MRILVVYASHVGATRGIAERIRDTLRAHSLAAEAQPAGGIEDPSSYDAFVVGSAVHGGRWLREATEFTRRHYELLAERPVWLFSSGPVGDRFVQAQQPDPREVVALRRKILPRDHRVFAGAFEGIQPTRPASP